MKKVVVIVLFTVISFFLYSIVFQTREQPPVISYTFDFDEMDKDFWLVGQWENYNRSYDLVSLKDGILKMTSDVPEALPYVLSRPIEIRSGDVITLKRKVKISHGDQMFAGGLAMYQTNTSELVPPKTDGSWFTAMGDGIALVEYSYDLSPLQKRPGKDVVRFLAADWEYNENFKLIPPFYDKWVEESLSYDTRSNQITYKIDDTEYKLNSYPVDQNNIRFLMHAYGEGAGNSMEIDWVEITVVNKKNGLK